MAITVRSMDVQSAPVLYTTASGSIAESGRPAGAMNGSARIVFDPSRGWRKEICAYHAAAVTAGRAYIMTPGDPAVDPYQMVTAVVPEVSATAVAGCIIGVPQESVSGSGQAWFTTAGFCEVMGNATIPVGSSLEVIANTSAFTDQGGEHDTAGEITTAVVGYAIDDISGTGVLGTAFLLGRNHTTAAS